MSRNARSVAEWLFEQHSVRLNFAPFPIDAGEADLAYAYDVQDHFVAILSNHGEGEVVGYKIGLTSRRMQQMCGIDHPVAGVVLSSRVHRSPARVWRRDFVRLGVESELAVQLSCPLEGSQMTPALIRKSVSLVCAGFELVDDRNAEYGALDPVSLVADNSWNAGIVLGPAAPLPDLSGLHGTLSVNGEVIDRGDTSGVLGDSLSSVAWLATHLAKRGGRLEGGEWVLTGSIVPTRFANAGEHFTFSLGALPSVELDVA